MADKHAVELGPVQQTLFIPLAGRAQHTRGKRPVLRDPKAIEILASVDYDASRYQNGGGSITVLRTAIFDWWVREFLAEHPSGTVVELGTGLNTRFERVDNGTVHWIDLDLPDTIELRRKFFTDTDRRRMLAASVLDDDWLDTVAALPGPYFFVSEGVLVYLPEDDVFAALTRLARRFPDAHIALDTYSRQAFDQQKRRAEQGHFSAPWVWPCDDPAELEQLGLRIVRSTAITRPPRTMRRQLPTRYRVLLPLVHPVLGRFATLTLFQT